MKNLFLIFFIILSFSSSAQKVAGFYSGTLYNDSTKLVQNYELALSEYRGKITGYSYVTFVVKDTFYYGIRRVKANIVGDSLIIEDDKIILNNFPESPAKRVYRTVTIPLNGQDSLVSLTGRWKTNRTKLYYPIPGSVQATKAKDLSSSPLLAHLKDLNISLDENENIQKVKVKEDKTKIKSEVRIPQKKVEPALPYDQRKNKALQVLEVSSDSLLLSFYDNGIIDGDSVSVYLNDRNIISNSRLTATAIKKIIHLAISGDSHLVLVAENLGTLPPNTGLLVIKDGEQTYQVNFSADLQTNAEIIIRRKVK
jgi:hypothetical protein